MALFDRVGDQAISSGGVGCPKKLRLWVMPEICQRRAGIRDGKDTITRLKLMTHVFDVVKFGLTSTSGRSFTKWPTLVTV